jgi:acetyltransferase-like isoleucine patch superfamily enzyme
MSYRPPTAAASTVIASQTSGGSVGGGSGGSSSTSSGHGSYHASMMQAPLAPGGYKSERAKMLEGKLYKHFHDEELKDERLSCKRALEAFNDANKGSSTLSSAQREQFFPPIINPKTRPDKKFLNWDGPQGSVGSYTTVESPFSCEFGYNIHLGNRVFIGEGCTLQDARKIRIGNNTIIGPNVKFYCLTTSVDATQRAGCQGEFYAGPITVEDHVFIGADSIIMPFRTIGRGAVVGAGSVVTRVSVLRRFSFFFFRCNTLTYRDAGRQTQHRCRRQPRQNHSQKDQARPGRRSTRRRNRRTERGDAEKRSP